MPFTTFDQIPLVESTIFATAVFLHVTKKSTTAVFLYVAQSLAIVLLLLPSFFQEPSLLLLVAVLATIAVKIIIAPHFFLGLIRKFQLTATPRTYVNTPITLAVLAILVVLVQARFFTPLVPLIPLGKSFIFISIATILISFFLIINRRGALSQMLGILSLENGLVSFAVFAGLEQSPELQLGITFNILIWIIIASVFASMIYRQTGTLDVSTMKRLTD